MSFLSLLNDQGQVLSRSVTAGMVDQETFTEGSVVQCRVMKSVSNRRTSPDGSEKIQYGTFITTRVVLPAGTAISIHNRFRYRERDYNVVEVIEGRDRRGVHHLVAVCEARA